MKLTKARIDRFAYEGDGNSRDVRWDDTVRGLGVRVYPSGRKAFVLSYRVGGRKRLLTLGEYGTLTLDKARDKAIKEKGQVLDGADPVAERRCERAGDTFKDLADAFLARYVDKTKRPRSAAEDRRLVERELKPRWGSRKVADISRRDVIELLDRIADRGAPITANRTLALVRKMFNWAVARDMLPASPVANVRGPGKETKRDRVLDDAELALVWNAAGDLGWPFGPFVRVLILTAQRRGEVAAMRWDDLDLEGGEPTWTLPREATKADRRHVVPLAPQVVEILKSLPRLEGAERVFASGRRRKQPASQKAEQAPLPPLSGFSKAKRDLDDLIAARAKKADAEPPAPWRVHDLRRTAASGMARLNVAPHILTRVLNHAPGGSEGVTALYNRHAYAAEMRHALTAWAAHVERVVAGEDTGNVVELARSSA